MGWQFWPKISLFTASMLIVSLVGPIEGFLSAQTKAGHQAPGTRVVLLLLTSYESTMSSIKST